MKDIPTLILEHDPTAEFYHTGDQHDLGGLVWINGAIPEPTAEVIAAWREEEAAQAYRTLRAKAYPPIADYVDAVVKGDQAQLQAYIEACLAVKAKYPKPPAP